MPNRHIVAVYGSLKAGCYNHEGLGANKKFIGHSTIVGCMYLRGGSYPVLYKPSANHGRSGPKVHAIELYEIDETNYQSITRMEIGAGYRAEQNRFYVPALKQSIEATIYWTIPPSHPGDEPITAYTNEMLGAMSRF